MKHYKIKFCGDNPKKACKKFIDNCPDDEYIVSSKKKSVIIEAKNKKKAREILNTTRATASYREDYCFGAEGMDFTFKKVDLDTER